MALRAARFAVKNCFAGGGIARHRRTFGFSLEHPQIFDQSFYCWGVQAAERWHTVRRNSVCDDLCQSCVGAILSLLRRGDVGSAFAAAAVKPVATGAPILECLASFRDRTLTSRWVILRRGCTLDSESERRENDGNRNDCESFESRPLMRMICGPLAALANAEEQFESLGSRHGHNLSGHNKNQRALAS